MGEADLIRWAIQVGIVANPSIRDKRGWDFILEFPTTSITAGLPFDRLPVPVQCLVQVKATDRRGVSWPMKLSNWKRLVDTPLPAFFLFLEYDGLLECQRAYLVHVGETQMKRVLRALRELTVREPDAALHRKALTVAYGPEERLGETNGQGLLQAIRKHVPDFATYAAKKQAILESAGYEEGGWHGEGMVRFPPKPEGIPVEEHLINWSLGLLGDGALVPGMKIFDERFGIRLPEPIRTFDGDGRIVPKAFTEGTLRLRSAAYCYTFSVELYSSGSMKEAVSDESKHKIRVKAPFFDLFIPIADSNLWKITLRLPNISTPISVSELRPISDIANLIGDGHKLELEIDLGEDRISGSISFREDPHPDLFTLGRTIERAMRTADRLGIRKEMQATIIQLLEQAPAFELIDRALTSSVSGGHIMLPWSLDNAIPSVPVACPMVLQAQVGNRMLRVGVVYKGMMSRTDTELLNESECALETATVEVYRAEAVDVAELENPSASEILEMMAVACGDTPVIHWWPGSSE
jgi:hypothetical protein